MGAGPVTGLPGALAGALDGKVALVTGTSPNIGGVLASGLADKYELTRPQGAFYAFPKAPGGSATEFAKRAVEHSLLIIPGNIFSRRDTHFRISYAAEQRTLERGVEVLKKLAKK